MLKRLGDQKSEADGIQSMEAEAKGTLAALESKAAGFAKLSVVPEEQNLQARFS